MEHEDFYVVVVENVEAGVTGSELKLTVIDVSDALADLQSGETTPINDHNVPSKEDRFKIDNTEGLKVKIEKEEIEMLFDVIDDVSVKLEALSDDNLYKFTKNNEAEDIMYVQLEDLPGDTYYTFSKKNEMELRDKNLDLISQIECPKKKSKRLLHYFKDTLLKNERRVVEQLCNPKYSYRGDSYICELCGYTTSKEKNAIRHYRFRHGPRSHFCLACKTAYRRHDSLLVHERLCISEYAEILRKARASIGSRQTIRSKNRNNRRPCPTCGKLIPRGSMKQHSDFHAGIHYECDECGSRYHSKHSLIQHISKHTTLTVYQCDQCPRTYASARGLKRHESDHVSEAFICDICGRDFLRQGSLQQHIMINHTERPYILCQLCGRSYKQKTSFRRHHCQTSKKTPIYQCMKCNRRFSREVIFKKHLNLTHGLDTSQLVLDFSNKAKKCVTHTTSKTTMRNL